MPLLRPFLLMTPSRLGRLKSMLLNSSDAVKNPAFRNSAIISCPVFKNIRPTAADKEKERKALRESRNNRVVDSEAFIGFRQLLRDQDHFESFRNRATSRVSVGYRSGSDQPNDLFPVPII